MAEIEVILDLKYINRPKFFVVGSGVVTECFVSKNEYVLKGQTLFSFEEDTTNSNLEFTSPISGKLTDFVIQKNDIVKRGILIGRILDEVYLSDFDEVILEQSIGRLCEIEIVKTIDDFDKSETVSIAKIAGKDEEYFKMISVADNYATYFIGLTFQYYRGKHYLKVCSSYPEFLLLEGVTLILLFEGETNLTFIFNQRPKISSNFNLSINSLGLDKEGFQLFMTKDILKWRLTNNKGEHLYGDFSKKYIWHTYKSSLEARYLLKMLAKKYLTAFQHFD